ncbi:hypothetical protein [Pseudonocardia lacus]|uniref:hypothetical protein n=1 Tax=Pseudonocardia lacus TaxID=2835865 RepID=UPI001BDC43C6|nr:hypothetical protein [Pseudonocardia lacus]
MSADPVMAVLRVRVPDDVDPAVVEAELTRAFWKRSVAAELVLLPPAGFPSPRCVRSGLRQHGFIAVLSTREPEEGNRLTGVAQKAARKRLRRRFGPRATARVRLARPGPELEVGWFSMRGTPHRV